MGCMQQHDNAIYVSAPLRRLRDAQTQVLMPELQRCVGTHALLLGAADNDTPPSLPMLGCWVRLYQNEGHYEGDLRAAADEPLPFVDDAFDLVLLRHALEVSPVASDLLVDAIRVLAPGGVLALAGVHPASTWSPWLRWRTRGRSLRLQWPLRLRQTLRHEGLRIELAQRVGRGWPGLPSSGSVPGNTLGGGYVLIARKQRRLVTPLRIKPVNVAVPAGGRLSPDVRRAATLRTTEVREQA
jgi:SAM-dependent methyltransferase